ncbi:hypothetical protein SAMN05877809_10716 [Rhodobacter sp. JA431]|uniref:hypothetical protein n=1 Tax=Rhodobacter sp. JA431 TaxID=570013 RepID=UPI000BCB7FC3|nr:hypothetical protein [Rhodobacter sp. JA431]SOC13794.1 hypothetical protein SAMN05877809_10716 [Rhodobacter sp. JA431]
MHLSGAQLAAELGLSRARVSQLVSEGKLDGCFTGAGRDRRFDLTKAKIALRQRLDPGQMLGNGAATKKALRAEPEAELDFDAPAPRKAAGPVRDGVLPPNDPDRYELAKIESAEQDARRKRRDNERDEGKWVLAEAAEREAARLLAREVGQFEVALRDAARALADAFSLDAREVRRLLLTQWRRHRGDRAEALAAEAEGVPMTEAERDASV